MTTGIYKRGQYIAADKRSVWWNTWIEHDVNKISEYHSKFASVYLINSWIKLINEVKLEMLEKYFGEKAEWSFHKNLYLLKDEIKTYMENFEFLIIFIIHTSKWDVEEAYKLVPNAVENVNIFCSIGSWWYLADGIHLKDPNTSPWEYFELISRFDINTWKEFDLIHLTKKK